MSNKSVVRAFAVCVILSIGVTAFAQRPMTPEDLWRVQRVGPPTLSPDGKWCAVEVTTYDIDANDSTSQIWLLATDGKTQKQLTRTNGKNSNPKWSPDGKSIAFISKRGGDDVPQIHTISPEGGEARRLTSMPFAPSALKWSGDSKSIYCIGWTWPDTADDAAHQKREKEQKSAKPKPLVIDNALYRYWDKWLTDGKRPYVFAADAATGKHRNLMAGTGHSLPLQEPGETHYDVAPDGKELCYVHDNVAAPGLDTNLDLFTLRLDAKDAKPKCITEHNKANDWNPVYSPDGRRLAFLRRTVKFFYADRARIMIRELGSENTRELTANWVVSLAAPKWFANSKSIYAEAEWDGYIKLVLFLTPLDGHWTFEDGLDCSERAVDIARLKRMTVCIRDSLKSPSALYSDDEPVWVGMGFAHSRSRIDHFNDALVAQWKPGKVENRTFKGAGGEDVQMWVVYPPDFDPKKKWPLVHLIHGGPHSAFLNDFNFRWNPHVWAARGWVVAMVNFHGSSGFGQDFADSITGDLGTKPMIDILKATDWFAEQPWIDAKRMAAAGASYGGYMTAWLGGNTDRFKAYVCHAGVYNWHSMMAGDILRVRDRALGATAWGDLSKIDKQSPHRFAKNFKTPTLISHGELDYRVPVTQGFEYYNTLKQKGVPTRMVYFPDENHWIMKPQNSLLWHREVFAWLEKYIGVGPTK